jgi:methionyl-tRNA formyltransferase
MNASSLLLENRPTEPFLPRSPTFPEPKCQSLIRVALFGSFYGGYHVLQELLGPELRQLVKIVGVATDDPGQPFVHPKVRLWKYPHSRAEELLVPLLATANGLPLYDGNIRAPEFQEIFFNQWKPDFCLMATFGQKIPRNMFSFPARGFFNFHHSDSTWPSYPGPDPIAAMIRDGRTNVFLTMHEVTDILDGGKFVARSPAIELPHDGNAVIVHRKTWPQMGPFIRAQVRALLDQTIH